MIHLYFSNGKACVWNANDWILLRQNYRILGELIGTIANFPRQNSHPGFPLALMHEEVMVLLEEGFCKLFEYCNFHKPPCELITKLACDTEMQIFIEQRDCMREKRIEQLSSRIDAIASGKQKKMAEEGHSNVCDKEILLKEEIEKLPSLSIENSLVQIPTEHPWPYEQKEITLDEFLQSSNSDKNSVRYKVFKDLWNRGFFVSAGTKFGADFLVYLGDPVKFHAMYMIKCVNKYVENISLKRLIAFGRLGVSVNKLTVIAYLNKKNSVAYQTLQWHDTLS